MSKKTIEEYTASPQRFLSENYISIPDFNTAAQIVEDAVLQRLNSWYKGKDGVIYNNDTRPDLPNKTAGLDDVIKLIGFGQDLGTAPVSVFFDIDYNVTASWYEVNFYNHQKHPHCLRCYFLPWYKNKMTYMRLFNQNTNNPLYFFTSSLSGCNVYVDIDGYNNEPVVYHANAGDITEVGLLNPTGPKQGYMHNLYTRYKSKSANSTYRLKYHHYINRAASIAQRKRNQGRTITRQETLTACVTGYNSEGNWNFVFQCGEKIAYTRSKSAVGARILHGKRKPAHERFICEAIPDWDGATK